MLAAVSTFFLSGCGTSGHSTPTTTFHGLTTTTTGTDQTPPALHLHPPVNVN